MEEAAACRRCRGELLQSRMMVFIKKVIPEVRPLPHLWGSRRRNLDLDDVLLPE
jgi:hypothetical protein